MPPRNSGGVGRPPVTVGVSVDQSVDQHPGTVAHFIRHADHQCACRWRRQRAGMPPRNSGAVGRPLVTVAVSVDQCGPAPRHGRPLHPTCRSSMRLSLAAAVSGNATPQQRRRRQTTCNSYCECGPVWTSTQAWSPTSSYTQINALVAGGGSERECHPATAAASADHL